MDPTKTNITIECLVEAAANKVWDFYTNPNHIVKWNTASDDWRTTRAENDLRVGGKFLSRMEAKDGSFGFDFWGIYDEVKTNQLIAYTMGDGRKAKIDFTKQGNDCAMIIIFEAENENPVEMQKQGWQAILNNFKKYTESN
jgi:uncharacterized protein YndB with AHSA1/START domain